MGLTTELRENKKQTNSLPRVTQTSRGWWCRSSEWKLAPALSWDQRSEIWAQSWGGLSLFPNPHLTYRMGNHERKSRSNRRWWNCWFLDYSLVSAWGSSNCHYDSQSPRSPSLLPTPMSWHWHIRRHKLIIDKTLHLFCHTPSPHPPLRVCESYFHGWIWSFKYIL